MTIDQAIKTGIQTLSNSESPETDCSVLLCHLLQCNSTYLHTWPDKALTKAQQQAYSAYLAQRLKGRPIAHIIGQRGFWTLDLKVTPDTLIPRPDTEILVNAALEKITPKMCIADLGTGTGAIGLALASERADITVIATDYSAAALVVAKQNIAQTRLNNVMLWQGDWLSAITRHSLDMIVSNPPYIEIDDPHLRQGDVGFEPLSALVSGQDGLNDIRSIVEQAQRCLKPLGWLMIEHGFQQAKEVKDIFQQAGLEKIETVKDFGGNDRVTLGQQTL
jgi:release factor glutamine methyltransferase